jgi:hypothetical protein
MNRRIEWQVSNLELSKKLRELGVEKNSYFCWIDNQSIPTELEYESNPEWEVVPYDEVSLQPTFHAYTVAELGEMLRDYELECIWFPECEQFGAFQTCSGVDTLYADTEADAQIGDGR